LNLPRGSVDEGTAPTAGRAAGQLIGSSPAIAAVREMIGKLARSQAPVYISGESGQRQGTGGAPDPRAERAQHAPFVPVNCGAIPENLMESEFFGYRKGAFTGADSDREGFFQAANGGTLFLDEVADLPLHMQVKLLRAIQEKKVRKVGSAPPKSRSMCASSRQRTASSRIASTPAVPPGSLLPPERDRAEDAGAARAPGRHPACWSTRRCAHLPGAPPPQFERRGHAALCAAYPYPGNVRELENILERATALCADEQVELDDLQLASARRGRGGRCFGETLDDHINRVEKQLILDALAKTGFNRTAAARCWA
jgi:two-component system response regulator PilR (NtrC family)